MEQGLPSWMNAEFTQGVLRRSEKDDTIEVVGMNSKPVSSKGENFCSDMYRILVDFTRKKADEKITEKKSIILKLAPKDASGRRDLVEQTGLFEMEMDMMTDVLKKMNAIVGNNHRFNAKVYHVKKEYPGYLIFEDLAPSGFCMTERQSGLDLDHCLLVMRNLAKFHASSVILCEREPSHKTRCKKGLFSIHHPEMINTYFTNGVKELAKAVEHWPELGPKYAKKIMDLSKTLYTKAGTALKPQDGEFNVINHGDVWVNNMMFQYDNEGKPVGHIFVDFQLCVYSSPAIDLHYFLSSSPSEKVYDESKELLLEEYLRTLTSCLKEFGYKGTIPTMDVLQRHIKEHEYYSVLTSFVVTPLVVAESELAVDLNDMINMEGTYYNPTYNGTAYRRIITKRILYFEKRGLLDN